MPPFIRILWHTTASELVSFKPSQPPPTLLPNPPSPIDTNIHCAVNSQKKVWNKTEKMEDIPFTIMLDSSVKMFILRHFCGG